MGNIICIKQNICKICLKKIENNELYKCVRCNAVMHIKCYDNYWDNGTFNYTQCIECNKIGTIGVLQN